MSDQIRFYTDKLTYEIDSWDLSVMMNNGDPVVVLDVRSREQFAQAHVPGAVSFPHREMNEASTAQLNRDLLYVTYCDGIGCNGSTKGALKMATLGFQVKELIGGFDWWKRDGHPTADGEAACAGGCGCG